MLNQQYIQYALWFLALSDLALGLYVYTKNTHNYVNRAFFIMCFSVFLWVAGIAIFRSTDNLIILNIASRMYYIGAAWISLSFYFLSLIFPSNNYQEISWQKLLLVFFSVIFLSIILPINFLIGHIETSPLFNQIDVGNMYYLMYSLFFLIFMLWGVIILFIKSKILKGSRRLQINFVLIGTSMAAIPGIIFNLFYPWFGNYKLIWVGPLLASLIWLIVIAYTIIAHRLFDIKVIIRRTVVYSILLAFVLGIYSTVIFVSASVLGNPTNMGRTTTITNLIAAILIAVGFEPLRKYLTKITDQYLFKQAYDPQQVIKELTDTLGRVLALDEALVSMMNIVVSAFKISRTAVLVIYDESARENQIHVHSIGYVSNQKARLNIKIDDPIIKYIRQKRSLEVIEELERGVEDKNITSPRIRKLIGNTKTDPLNIVHQLKIIDSVVKKAQSLEIAVLMPIIVRDKVIGIFVVGPKLSGDSFTDSDLKLLEIISGQTASAIEQARLYEDDQTKSEFVSIASHELLTPTSAIEGYLSMILDEHIASVDETATKYLQRVQNSAKRLSNLVKDLLSVSRIEAGRIKINIEAIQVELLIENVVSDLLPTTKEKKLSLTFLKSDQALPLCLADSEKLTQVIINLVGNAIKYTPEGSVLILAEKKDDKIKITVEDTGVGIKQEDLPHLFEKFYRVDNTETVGIVGSGLGLYISKSLIEMMDGEINVESTEWHGSRFMVTLPIVVKKEGKK